MSTIAPPRPKIYERRHRTIVRIFEVARHRSEASCGHRSECVFAIIILEIKCKYLLSRTTWVLVKYFTLRNKINIQAECEAEAEIIEDNGNRRRKKNIEIRADHIAKIAAELLLDLS